MRPASTRLRLAQSTVSGQIRSFEEVLGEKLFTRNGRRLVPTETGRLVYSYAEEIFSLGQELQDAIKGRPVAKIQRLVVGIVDVVPKLIVRKLLEPALKLSDTLRVVCREDKSERLLAELAVHELDVILTDSPVPPTTSIRAFSHLLGECGVSFLATARLARPRVKNFPASLDGAPMLLPTDNTALRRSLDRWFAKIGVRPQIMGEFEDSALLKVFGQTGEGIFPATTIISDEVQRQHQVRLVGKTDEVRERFYAISVERRLKHPAVIAIHEEARRNLFG